jgi:hypothetical protein
MCAAGPGLTSVERTSNRPGDPTRHFRNYTQLRWPGRLWADGAPKSRSPTTTALASRQFPPRARQQVPVSAVAWPHTVTGVVRGDRGWRRLGPTAELVAASQKSRPPDSVATVPVVRFPVLACLLGTYRARAPALLSDVAGCRQGGVRRTKGETRFLTPVASRGMGGTQRTGVHASALDSPYVVRRTGLCVASELALRRRKVAPLPGPVAEASVPRRGNGGTRRCSPRAAITRFLRRLPAADRRAFLTPL